MSQTNEPSFVIALSGPSGAGKSTLLQELALHFEDAVTLQIDDYEATSIYPDTAQWLAEGADPNAFHTPQFIADICSLRAGFPIFPPTGSVGIQPSRFLIIEEPFGRGRDKIRDCIDFVVHIDIPFEIALARKLLRQNKFLPWEQDTEVFIAHLQEFLEWYLSVGRAFYLAIRERVLKDCDLIIDGTRSTEEIAETIVIAVRASQQQS